MAIGDLDGDGHPDLAVPVGVESSVGILMGRGDGTFDEPVLYVTGQSVGSVAMADLNGDGLTDLFIGHANSEGTMTAPAEMFAASR